MFETHACMNITEICAVWFGNEHVVMYTHWTRSDWFEFEIPMAHIIWPRRIRAWTHYSNWRWWAAFASHIYIYTPIYIILYYIFFILCAGNFNFGIWSLDEANPMVQRWQIWALLAVGYHLDSTRFRHMYNLEDSMVELKHNAQTSKHKHFLFVLESSVSELPKCFSTWFAIICFYFMSYNAQFHES